jgi:predicted phosphodiesterase
MTDKLRSYTNSDGMTVEVSKEHLDCAIKIKIELQDSVPSRKCNWSKHKELMESEGFYDSDTNEAYRCLIKDYQKEVGLLVPVDLHKSMVAEGRLASINKLVGDIYAEKRENQVILNEINKHKRELSLVKVITEEIREIFLDDINFTIPHYVFNPRLKTSNNKAIVVLTDLHIGKLIEDIYENAYNYEIAIKRMNEYKKKVLEYCNCFGITEVTVTGLGDIVEHVNMRYKQKVSTEFGLAQQIHKATKIVIDFLVSLSEYVNVEYVGIAGNHDRFQGDKNIAYEDDNANAVVNFNIKTFIELTGASRLTYIDIADDATEINKTLNGVKFKLAHGHLDGGNKQNRMKSKISMENDFFDVFIYGHLHNYDVKESDRGRMTIGVGSLAGREDYSVSLSSATDASQLMVVVTDGGDILPLRVALQIV